MYFFRDLSHFSSIWVQKHAFYLTDYMILMRNSQFITQDTPHTQKIHELIMHRNHQVTVHYYLRKQVFVETVGIMAVCSLLSDFGTSPAIAETADCS